ncbi:MAG: type II secretion system F family protein [Sedimentisphaerales bacterium]|nr:type II secretion system F family protein [Sedimentisphaerales bacterium]
MLIITLLVLVCYIYLGWKFPTIALVTSPFVAGSLTLFGVVDGNTAVVVIAPGIFIVTIIAVLLSKPEPGDEQWPHVFAKWILILFVFFLLSVTLGAAFGPLGVSGIVLVVIFFGLIIAYGLTSRLATDAYVISTIGSIMRQNLPLSMALESAAGGRADKRSRILNQIQKWLVQGYSLSESIKRGYPKCPGYAVAMIAAAERINQLPLAIQAIEADMVTQADERRKIRPVHPLYPVILMVFMFFMLMGVMTFVIPSYQTALMEMFEGPMLPAATRFLIGITSFAAFEFAWVTWPLLILLVIAIIPISIYIKFRPRRPHKPYLLSRIGDFVKWYLPVLHNFEKNYSLVQVVELLRLSLSAGCSVNDAIKNTLGLDVNNRFRKRLQRWLEKAERGDNIAAAIRESKLGSPLAWAFDEKVNQGNTLMILKTLESFYRSNYSYCVNLARFIMWPCLILLMGLIVGFVVYAIFSPSILIIEALSGKVLP